MSGLGLTGLRAGLVCRFREVEIWVSFGVGYEIEDLWHGLA